MDEKRDQEQDQDQGPGVVSVEHYGAGVIVRGEGGRFLPGSRTPKPITSEKAHEFARARKEKAAAAIRAQIKGQTQNRLGVLARSSLEAVAIAAGILWDEVVMNPDAYPRDRLEAWLKIGEKAGILAAADQDGPGPGPEAGTLAALGREAVTEFIRARQRQRDQDQEGS